MRGNTSTCFCIKIFFWDFKDFSEFFWVFLSHWVLISFSNTLQGTRAKLFLTLETSPNLAKEVMYPKFLDPLWKASKTLSGLLKELRGIFWKPYQVDWKSNNRWGIASKSLLSFLRVILIRLFQMKQNGNQKISMWSYLVRVYAPTWI